MVPEGEQRLSKREHCSRALRTPAKDGRPDDGWVLEARKADKGVIASHGKVRWCRRGESNSHSRKGTGF